MANGNLLIENFNQNPIEKSIKSSTGITIKATVGPQSFVSVTEAQVGQLPWTVESPGFKPLNVDKLPAVVAYGQFKPSGAFPLGYLTAVIYPQA